MKFQFIFTVRHSLLISYGLEKLITSRNLSASSRHDCSVPNITICRPPVQMGNFFSCGGDCGRYVFNVFFFSLVGTLAILFTLLGSYLLYKRRKLAKRKRLLFRSRTNTTNTNSSIQSGGQQIGNFILGRPPVTDVILGVYGDDVARTPRTAFYEEMEWRGFAY